MTTAYTSLLGLALPVTGELSGTWGDTVNDSITSLLDSAVAGTTTISSDADVTLTTTTGASNTSRQAILLWTAGGTVTRNITAPAQSKIYTVINKSSSTQSIVLRGAGPTTGVTIVQGESAVCAWNGSDFIKISNTAGPGTFTNLTVTGNTSIGDADTDTITQAASYVTGTQLKSAKTATNTLSLAAYDVDGTAYTNLITLTASNTPTLALTSTGVGTINNMSIGATTASTGAFTTLSASGAVTLSGGTINGVAYLNGTNVLTTGSALTFDGSNVDLGTVGAKLNFATTGSSTKNYIGGSADGYSLEMVMQRGASQPLSYKQNFSVGHEWGIAGSGAMTLTSTGLTTTGTINLITVGRGAGAVSTNTAVGALSIGASSGGVTGAQNTAGGYATLSFITSGAGNTGFGYAAVNATTTGGNNTAVGAGAFQNSTTGSSNTALGAQSLASNTTASNNTAVGYQAGYSNTTGQITAIGNAALYTNTTGTLNTAVGINALITNSTGSNNTAMGMQALNNNTTASNNTAIGYQAAYSSTIGDNTAIGYSVLSFNTTGQYNVAVGGQAGNTTLNVNTTGSNNTAVGMGALGSNTTASNNTAVGYQAGYSNTTGAQNLNLGNFAGYTNSTGTYNVFVGYQAGYNSTAGVNCFVGVAAGYNVTTGTGNTFIGANSSSASGYYVTTGSKNTILGGYNGNQGGLDIRTASNYIVLSDGDGNPRLWHSGSFLACPTVYSVTTASTPNVFVDSAGGIYRGGVSALKYKQDIRDLEEIDISLIRAVRYKSKCEIDDKTKDYFGVVADQVAEAGIEELVTRNADGEVEGFQYERLTVVLLKAMQTLKAEVDSLKAQINGASA